MTFKIFVDTNVFVATRDTGDTTHQKVLDLIKYLDDNNFVWYTSSDVVGETLTVVSQKLGKEIAIDWYRDFLKSGIKTIFVNEGLHNKAEKLFVKTKPKNISYVDCSCVVAMEKEKINTIFSFDKDFKKMGVKLLEDVV